ncbi:Flp pilus assembly protein TadG [Caulobacter ginsengisoli]|uniref:Flp pilus assembly protein TadG n=1 Tax=Caulobacter ginsengisoli TaxID=400775 RepID=A0ABU0IWV6_9CAUL|nr:pilus assembly protein [Caulobacter ginsengisoli]MDQ0466493.1 Flp pilus assembly protein TadG [Caulobacter ginsengisoli]
MRGRAFGRFAVDRSGATAVELALVAPVLVVCLFGIFNLGLAYYSGAAVRNAVQRASRVLIASPATPASSLQASAAGMLANVPAQNLTLTVTATTIEGVAVKRVAWTYGYPLSIPFVPDRVLTFESSLLVAAAAS